MANRKIYLELTLGHRATLREKPTPEGFTHDWEVYVRTDQGQIQAFVDRVIFHLHETFPKPRRVVKEPPFSVRETGYAGFIIEIEVIFKNKDDPRKTVFQYDLYLQSDGPPITPCRKEKLVFNNPNEEFTKKLLEGGGVIRKEKDSGRSDSLTSATSSYQALHSGGKSSKHSSTNSAKASPKNSFENLFGTPIKRNSGSPSLTTSTVWATPNGSTKDSSSASASTGKGGKGERAFVSHPNGSSGGKGEKFPVDKSSSSSAGEKSKSSSKSPVMPTLLSPAGSEGSGSKPTSSKSSKQRRSPSEKRSKSEDKGRKMLPPEHSAVPKKPKKSDMFTPSPSSTSVSHENSTKSSEKFKKKSSKHTKVKIEDEAPYASPPETISRKESRKDSVHSEVKKERRDKEKSLLSPISSSSRDSSPSSTSSRSEINSEEEDDTEVDSEREEEMLEKSNKRIVAANSTSSSKRRSTQPRHSESDSESEQQSPVPQRSPPSSPASSSSSLPSPPTKRRKSSNSSSHTPDQRHSRSESPMEKPNSSSSVKVKKESRHHKRSDDEKRNRNSRKKSKKFKKKVFEEDHDSDSSVSSAESYASPTSGNGITSNGLSPNPGFSVASTSGTFTLEMGILQELYARINTLGDPEKLQEVVDIVMDSCGQDLYSTESGLSFDFDLCKLSPTTIRKIQEAILD